MVELPHLGSVRVEDTTYLGMLFSRSAHSPVREAHRVANHSSLRRPSSRASARRASSVSTSAHGSRSLPPNWPNQPPSLKPSCPSGSWTTPSSEAFVVITIFPIWGVLSWAVYFPAFVEASAATKTERRVSRRPDVITCDAGERTSRCEDASMTEQTLARARRGDED